jgi:iron complex outermembrane receptor protein
MRTVPGLVFTLLCCQAFANDSADTTSLAPVVVTATRQAQPAFEFPASVDSVALNEVDANTPGINASEYLLGVAGVVARNRQNYAQDEQISIRGFGARSSFGVRDVRLFSDGIPASMPDGQGQVSNFNFDSADRIEVLRGPFAALYGNASGGVIQIFTADGGDPPQMRSTISAGDYGTYRIGVGARGADGAVDYNLALSHFYLDGYRAHGRAERNNANVKTGIRIDENRKLTLIANSVVIPNADDPLGLTPGQFEQDPRQAKAVAVQFDTRKSVHQNQFGAIYEQALDANQDLTALAYYGQRSVVQFQAIPLSVQAKPTSPGGVIDLGGDYGGADLHWVWHGMLAQRAFDITAGATYDRQDTQRRGYNNFIVDMLGVQGDLRRDEQDDVYNFDQYLQATWDFAPRWKLSAGARHSAVHFSVADHFLANGDDSGSRSYSAITPVVGLLFRAAPVWRLYAAYGTGFETPTFNELGYRIDGSAGINFDLLPARSRNGEIGSKLKLGPGELDLAVFRADTSHELAVDTSGGGRTTYQNIDHARRQGAEASFRYAFAGGLSTELIYTYTDASFRSAFLTCSIGPCTTPTILVDSGTQIPGVPRALFHAELAYRAGVAWNAKLETEAASRTPVNDVNSQFAPGYAVLDASIGYVFARGGADVSTFLRLSNAFDRRYVGSVIVNESNGRYFEPAAGRTLFAGCSIAWKH